MTDKIFAALLMQAALPLPVEEFQFDPSRKWRMDYAWPEAKLGLEVDGGIWSKGRHTRGVGWLKDTEKLNRAAALGWRMLRCTPQTLYESELFEAIKAALAR